MKKTFNLKDCALAFLLSILGVLCASFLLINLITTVAESSGQDVSIVQNEEWILYINMFLSEIIFLITFAVVCLISKTKNFMTVSKIKFKFNAKIFVFTVLASLVTMFASINMTGLFNHIFSFISPVALTDSIGVPLQNIWQFLLVALLLGVMPAICEELVFRGIIYNGLRRKYNVKISVIFSAILFALIHFSIYKTFYQLILGIVLAVLVYYTGTIFYSMVFHFVNNFTIILINFIGQSGTALQFSFWGAKEILLTILIFALGVVAVVLFLGWLKKHSSKHKNYYNLDPTPDALDKFEMEQSQGFDKNTQMQTYEEKLLTNEQQNSGVILLIFSVFIGLVLWSISSFGGFI